jgi:DNA (cytosine-5)-methyltransferase 1
VQGSKLTRQDQINMLERVDELLEVTYRSADLGNVANALSETVYILLAKQTRESVYQPIFKRLRQRFPRWQDMLNAPASDLEDVLRAGGFQRQRTAQLKALLLAVQKDNLKRGVGPALEGEDLTLAYLRDMSDHDVEAFLLGLPGIGPKSARCVMSYALDRQRFAVDTHVHRIFSRLRLVRSAGRKSDHDPFEAIVPARMRKRLHVNLIHHGRAVCHSTAPRCSECVLVSFCREGRSRVNQYKDPRPRAADLFAGAGGMGLGFREAGYRIVAAVERDRHAAQTYRANNPGVPVLEADVTKLSGRMLRRFAPPIGKLDAILAGPPCQGYSAAGTREPSDPRNQMFRHVGRLASELRAKIVIFENVPGLRRVNGMGFLDRILKSLGAYRYRAAAHLLTASDFGVPQNRRRYFIVGKHASLGGVVSAPNPTHRLPGNSTRAERPVTPTVLDTLEDLPALAAGMNAEYYIRADGSTLLNGSTMAHSDKVLAKIELIRPGGGPISYRRLEGDLARTLVAGHRALPVHPTLHRTMSVREAARIQGFPDTYVFCGPKAEQPLQVANAVPPPVAKALGLQVIRHLQKLKPVRGV